MEKPIMGYALYVLEQERERQHKIAERNSKTATGWKARDRAKDINAAIACLTTEVIG